MAFQIRRVDYFRTTVKDEPGTGYKLLSLLEEIGINLLAFNAIPVGSNQTQLMIFPEDSQQLISEAQRAGLELDGPHRALLAQGDDELGALAQVHETLYDAHLNIYAASGVTDGRGSYGYVLYIRPQEYERAVKALGI